MRSQEWNEKLASVAKSKLKVQSRNIFYVRLPHMKGTPHAVPLPYANLPARSDDFQIAQQALKAYFHELATRGITCSSRRCEKKSVRLRRGTLALPFSLAYDKALKIGCAVEYAKNAQSVRAAKKSKLLFRAKMACVSHLSGERADFNVQVSFPRFHSQLYEVGVPCKECEDGHK